MPKENRKFFLVTCIITILPMFLGLFLWNRLPDQIATHFDFNGTPDGYSSKRFAVIGIYVFCLFMHIFCAVMTCLDPKKKNVSPKVYRLILCICPLVSLWCAALTYSNALHAPLHFINWGQSSHGCYLSCYRKLSAQMQAKLHHRHQTALDAGRRRKLELYSPTGRQIMDDRRHTHHPSWFSDSCSTYGSVPDHYGCDDYDSGDCILSVL